MNLRFMSTGCIDIRAVVDNFIELWLPEWRCVSARSRTQSYLAVAGSNSLCSGIFTT